jgi:hypothetical protein
MYEPKNAQEAARVARLFARAQGMAAQGYTLKEFNGGLMVRRPEPDADGVVGYAVDLRPGKLSCCCPAFLKSDIPTCKHILFAQMQEDEQMDRQAEEWAAERYR